MEAKPFNMAEKRGAATSIRPDVPQLSLFQGRYRTAVRRLAA